MRHRLDGPSEARQLLDTGRDALEKQYRSDPTSRIQLAPYDGREGDFLTARTILAEARRHADSIQSPRWQGEAR